jgi:acylphosphatase
VSVSRRAVHVLIHGRVQGVGYRAWTEARAVALGLDGWVRNRRDGTVEALFVGPDHAVVRMLADCAAGPRDAAVTGVEIVAEGGAADAGFRVLATA